MKRKLDVDHKHDYSDLYSFAIGFDFDSDFYNQIYYSLVLVLFVIHEIHEGA